MRKPDFVKIVEELALIVLIILGVLDFFEALSLPLDYFKKIQS